MPDLDGFEVCARLPASVMVVFTTAHDEHALRAFQTNAIDHLLKPVREDEGDLVRLSASAEVSSTTEGTRVRLSDGKTELAVARERARALKDRLGL